jgi:putative spermidine/putrescine transport system substrate-binding protein
MLTPRDGVDDAAQISVDANGGNGAAQDSVQLSQADSGTARTLNRVVLGLAAVAVLSLTTCIVAIADLGREPPVLRGGPGEPEADGGLGEDVASSAETPGGFPAPLGGLSWPTIVKRAEAQTLNFYLWSPDGTKPRSWVDTHLTGVLKDTYGITVNRMDAVYTGCDKAGMALVCDVATLKAAQDASTSTPAQDEAAVDLVWINGANFAAMASEGLLYGPWASLVPSGANFDFKDAAIAFDKGVPTRGLEIPFNSAQSIFIHNTAHVPSPPKTIAALHEWIKANPGRFSYSDATTDFTGAAFVRHYFYHFGGPWADLQAGTTVDETVYASRAPLVWAALNEIEPFLYKPAGTTQPWYPASHADDIRPLVADGSLWLDFSMQASEATAQQAKTEGAWPETTQGYVLDTPGTIADTNFLAIPITAPHKAAALVAANHIASAGEMFVRAQPEVWGALQAFDPSAPAIKEWDVAFNYIDAHSATPTVEALAAAKLPDLSAAWVARINADWATNVRDA